MDEAEERFAFGENWQAFLATLDDARVAQAETSLKESLGLESLGLESQSLDSPGLDSLAGKTFLDIGSGSGLFSLAAHRLGANIVSIDYDPHSVACTEELKRRYAADAANWKIQQGSALDESLMQSLGQFDVVYSWGVLHHTGEMNRAIDLAQQKVAEGGKFFIAIYNDQGGASRRWLAIKRCYHRLPGWLRPLWVLVVASWYEAKFALARLARLKNPLPFADWRAKKQDRGMSAWHDWVDWIGGLPFEVATPEQIIVPLRQHGFVLENLRTVGSGWGCNEFVFKKTSV